MMRNITWLRMYSPDNRNELYNSLSYLKKTFTDITCAILEGYIPLVLQEITESWKEIGVLVNNHKQLQFLEDSVLFFIICDFSEGYMYSMC